MICPYCNTDNNQKDEDDIGQTCDNCPNTTFYCSNGNPDIIYITSNDNAIQMVMWNSHTIIWSDFIKQSHPGGHFTREMELDYIPKELNPTNVREWIDRMLKIKAFL